MGYYKNASIPADGPDVVHYEQCAAGWSRHAACSCAQIDLEMREHLADLEIDRIREEGR